MFERVLFVGAHADDIELFAGGLLSRLCRESGYVRTITFSTHRGVGLPKVWAASEVEHRENMRSLGVFCDLYDLKACDGDFMEHRGFIYSCIATALSEFNPTCVVTHPVDDTNQDHQQVVAECLRVCKGATSVLHGEYPFNQMQPVAGNYYVRLTKEDAESKQRLISNYKSQIANHRRYFTPGLWTSMAVTLGMLCGWDFAERFTVGRLRYD